MCPTHIVSVEHRPSKSLLPQSEGDDTGEDDSNIINGTSCLPPVKIV